MKAILFELAILGSKLGNQLKSKTFATFKKSLSIKTNLGSIPYSFFKSLSISSNLNYIFNSLEFTL